MAPPNVVLYFCMQSTAKERAKHAGDYFTLLRHLLNYAYNSNINLPNAEVLLNNEIDWLKRIRVRPACCTVLCKVAAVAQEVEWLACNRKVDGSIPDSTVSKMPNPCVVDTMVYEWVICCKALCISGSALLP